MKRPQRSDAIEIPLDHKYAIIIAPVVQNLFETQHEEEPEANELWRVYLWLSFTPQSNQLPDPAWKIRPITLAQVDGKSVLAGMSADRLREIRLYRLTTPAWSIEYAVIPAQHIVVLAYLSAR